MNFSKRVIVVIVWLSYICIVLLCGEMFLRYYLIAKHNLKNFRFLAHNFVDKYDKYLGWSPIANAEGTHITPYYKVSYKINSHGFRGDEIGIKKKKGIFRIVCLGDSFTFGVAAENKECFPVLLNSLLNDENIEIINMGAAGYSLGQSILMLEQKGLKYKPNLAIMYLNIWNLERCLRRIKYTYGKPRYILKDDNLILTNCPVSKFFQLHDFLVRHCYLYDFLIAAIIRIDERVEKQKFKINPFWANEYNSRLASLLMEKLNILCKNNDITLLIITNTDEVKKLCSDLNIPCCNIRKQYLKTQAMTKGKLKYPEGHFSFKGNQFLAKQMYNCLSKNNFISKR